jgi:predicted site-specific integrase-resolvase
MHVAAGSAIAPCPHCAEGILMPIEQAIRTTSRNARTLQRWLEQGLLHFVESPEGRVEICHASLRKLAGRQ